MENSLITFKNKEILKQSELYGDIYKNIQTKEVSTFNDISINDIDDWYNSLTTKYNLNRNQINCLDAFLRSLEFVLDTIDPNKLDIKNDFIEDSDLMLWRESSKGISKIVFDEFGQIVYMFNGNDGRKLKGVFDIGVDMEKLLYRFISM